MSDVPREYWMPCTLGLEAVLADELSALGGRDVVVGRGGVRCVGDPTFGPTACLWLRSAIRVQELLAEFDVAAEDDLYRGAHEVPWERLLTPDHTLAVAASVRDSVITHSGFAALRIKDAVVDRMRERGERRPSVDRKRPDVPLKLVLKRGTAQLYRDLAGASLHKRGYRPVQVKSPLNEATAAGLLLLAGWDGRGDLVDPMCGSGTLLVEAAWIAADRAPGLKRRFAFERWPDHDRAAWKRMQDDARRRVRRSIGARLLGADRHAGALALARKSVAAAGVDRWVTLRRCGADELRPERPPRWVFTNPPYGERIGEGDDLAQSWDALSVFLKQRCPGAVAHVLSGSPELTRRLRLKADRRWPVRNGPIDCRLLRYRLHPAR